MRSTARARSNYSLLTLFVLAGTVASHVVHEIASSSCGIVRRVYKGHDLVRFASNFLSPEPTFCSGNPNFVTNLTMAPANFCSATRLSDGSFDQYLLEAVVLTRWHSSTREFSEKVALAPSPFFECSINASVEEPVWRKSWQLVGKRPPRLERNIWKSITPLSRAATVFRSYWKKLQLSFAPRPPYVQPWVVVIFGFANDQNGKAFLATLFEQPSSFRSRVIIGSLEGSHMLLQHQREYQKVPASLRPNFITLPYPVGVESAVRFTEPSGAYRPSSRRPIAVLLYWEQAKDGGELGDLGSVRTNLTIGYDRLPAASSATRLSSTGSTAQTVKTVRAVVCEPGGGGGGTAGGGGAGCRAAADLVTTSTIYDATVPSDFCLQPIGDTPKRSHFYLAVLSGCIPVIFDDARGSVSSRGHWAAGGLEGTQGTRWAWRGTAGFELDYRAFSVVYASEEVEHDLLQGNIFEDLAQMPARDPGRFEALKRGVDDAAKTMRYSLRECQYKPSEEPCDAFTAFEQVVEATIQQAGQQGPSARAPASENRTPLAQLEAALRETKANLVQAQDAQAIAETRATELSKELDAERTAFYGIASNTATATTTNATGLSHTPAAAHSQCGAARTNKFFSYMKNQGGQQTLMCAAAAKCGTTSLFQGIYTLLFGHDWLYHNSPFIQ